MPTQTERQPRSVVLDTNIVMDMLHFQDKRTNWLIHAITRGHIRCFSDTACLAELERVAAYPEFQLDKLRQETLLENYTRFVVKCEAGAGERPELPRCRDKDDQKFLELAARCHAEILVTRDKQLLRLARHRHKPPPFFIATADAAEKLLELPAVHPACRV